MSIEVCAARMQGAPASLRPCGRCWACLAVKDLNTALVKAEEEIPALPSRFSMRDGTGAIVASFSVGAGRRLQGKRRRR